MLGYRFVLSANQCWLNATNSTKIHQNLTEKHLTSMHLGKSVLFEIALETSCSLKYHLNQDSPFRPEKEVLKTW